MNFRTVFSLNLDVTQAMEDISNQIAEFNISPKLILYFLSPDINQAEFAKNIFETFKCNCIGLTSSGEYFDDKFFEKSIIAGVFDEDFFENFKILGIDLNTEIDFESIEAEYISAFGCSLSELSNTQYFAMLLLDVSDNDNFYNFDSFLDTFQIHTMIPLIGGMAGNYGKFTGKWVHFNGKIYQNHIILGVYKPSLEFDFLFTHNHRPTDNILFPTEFGNNNRIVKKYNGIAAGDAFCNAIGHSRNSLPENFLNKYTIAQEVFNSHFFVNHVKAILPDGSMEHYGRIKPNSELFIMQCGDITLETKNAMRINKGKNRDKFSRIIGIIEFSCRARTEELREENSLDRYSKLFNFAPHIGASTDTEIYFDSMNYTSVSLLFYRAHSHVE